MSYKYIIYIHLLKSVAGTILFWHLLYALLVFWFWFHSDNTFFYVKDLLFWSSAYILGFPYAFLFQFIVEFALGVHSFVVVTVLLAFQCLVFHLVVFYSRPNRLLFEGSLSWTFMWLCFYCFSNRIYYIIFVLLIESIKAWWKWTSYICVVQAILSNTSYPII